MTKRIGYFLAAAVVLLTATAGGCEDTQQCKAGQERTIRSGHSTVHQRCEKAPTDVTPQWHKV
jgi:hypothetical protein